MRHHYQIDYGTGELATMTAECIESKTDSIRVIMDHKTGAEPTVIEYKKFGNRKLTKLINIMGWEFVKTERSMR